MKIATDRPRGEKVRLHIADSERWIPNRRAPYWGKSCQNRTGAIEFCPSVNISERGAGMLRALAAPLRFLATSADAKRPAASRRMPWLYNPTFIDTAGESKRCGVPLTLRLSSSVPGLRWTLGPVCLSNDSGGLIFLLQRPKGADGGASSIAASSCDHQRQFPAGIVE